MNKGKRKKTNAQLVSCLRSIFTSQQRAGAGRSRLKAGCGQDCPPHLGSTKLKGLRNRNSSELSPRLRYEGRSLTVAALIGAARGQQAVTI